MVGAPLGGVLAATIGALNALYVDAVSFAAAAVLVFVLVRRRAHTVDTPTGVRGYLHELREGLRFALRDPLLRAIGVMVLVTNTFDQAQIAVLLPVWAKTEIGTATAVGFVGGAFGLGAVAGNAVFAVFAHRLPRRWAYACCFLLAGSPKYFAMGLSDSLTVVLVVCVASGVMCGAINPLLSAAEFERVPEHLRARVLGAVGSLAYAGIPVGGLLAGWLVSGVGVGGALLAVGGGYLLMTLLPFVQPAWRLMDRTTLPSVDAPTAVAR